MATKTTASELVPSRTVVRRLALLLALWSVGGCGSGEPEGEQNDSVSAPSSSTQSTTVPASPGDPAAPQLPEPAKQFSAVDPGFIVWESNRSGAWRLWTADLDGGGARQLTPDESRQQHCCAHIAPDGSKIAYLSLPTGRARYLDEAAVGELRLTTPDGTATRVLAPAARTYFEHRAVVWIDDQSLHYIAQDGSVERLDTSSGATSTVLPASGDLSRRWLVDASGRWAATGRGALAPLENGRLQTETLLPGCQPYFSRDGRWGFWTAGAGGPIDRFDLATGETATILRKNDSRLPEGRGYAYFPMLSSDGSLLAFAASEDEHDHHRADYDIFIAEVDPAKFELVGSPRAIAADPAVDRFPDLWRPDQNRDSVVAEPAPEPELRSVWPARSDGVLWSWTVDGEDPTTAIRQSGELVGGSHSLDLSRGAVIAGDTAERLHQGLLRTNQLTLEVVVTPPAKASTGLAAIVALSRDSSRENLVLGERGSRLVLRMRVGPKGRNAYAEADLGPLARSERLHLAISYSPGRAVVYRNGAEALRSRDLRGHFFQWRPYALTLGDRGRGGAAWSGRVEAIAIYDRPVSATEARVNADLLGRRQPGE